MDKITSIYKSPIHAQLSLDRINDRVIQEAMETFTRPERPLHELERALIGNFEECAVFNKIIGEEL